MSGLADTVPVDRHPKSCSIWFASDATTGEGICDCGLAESDSPAALYQFDLAAIMRAAGLEPFARPESPHMVVHEVVLPALRKVLLRDDEESRERLIGAAVVLGLDFWTETGNEDPRDGFREMVFDYEAWADAILAALRGSDD